MTEAAIATRADLVRELNAILTLVDVPEERSDGNHRAMAERLLDIRRRLTTVIDDLKGRPRGAVYAFPGGDRLQDARACHEAILQRFDEGSRIEIAQMIVDDLEGKTDGRRISMPVGDSEDARDEVAALVSYPWARDRGQFTGWGWIKGRDGKGHVLASARSLRDLDLHERIACNAAGEDPCAKIADLICASTNFGFEVLYGRDDETVSRRLAVLRAAFEDIRDGTHKKSRAS